MSTFSFIVEIVRGLKPGQAVQIDKAELWHDSPAPPGWTDWEWVLEKITGSSYEFSFWENPENRCVEFYRWNAPLSPDCGLRTYVSPDVRHLYEQLPNRLWRVKP